MADDCRAKAEAHQGGHHVAWIGPLVLPAADRYSMRVQSSLLRPGSTTPVHTHSGPEVIYIVDGEQCMETPEVGQRLGAGQFYMIPGGGIHRGRVTGSSVRRALALILYDAGHPAIWARKGLAPEAAFTPNLEGATVVPMFQLPPLTQF